ncbi:MAG: hypothetical protein P9F19_14195 [Candidatus Contendobacter sp.]|nr:hypothetical protein [Candidatus Contendobacter sp.]MDG4558523.1 hypothetical protein [Candidatus Contendobacter sp.]
MLIYLDTYCFNRPFDDQSQTRIRFKTEAKLELQQQVRQKKVGVVLPPGDALAKLECWYED